MRRKNEAKLHLVSERTGIVGIDIAKKRHWAKIINYNGYELTRSIMIYNDLEGFKKLQRIIQDVKNKSGLERVIVGMEPTGHYWKNIAYYLDDRKIPVVFVNPYHVHNSKEMWDNSPTKGDPKDALLIANLIKEGKFCNANLVRAVYADLRRTGKIYFRLKRKLWRALTELDNLIDEYFPECRNLFSSKLGKASRYILEEYFFPEKIIEAGFDNLRENLRKVTKSRLGEEKIQEVYSAAEKSVGIKEGKCSAKLEIELIFRR